jgi:TonB family protein
VCSGAPPPALGIAFLNGTRACLSIAAILSRGADVRLVNPLAEFKEGRATVVAPDSACEPNQPGDSTYRLSIAEQFLREGEAAIAIAGAARATLPISAFRACATHEGIHFTQWRDAPLEGSFLWHRYYYLGYDLEPTCTNQDYPAPFRLSGDVRQPVLIGKVDPVYPPRARSARVQGTVKLEADISQEGAVTNLHLVSGPPLLVQAAMQAARQYQYKPALVNGKPVVARIRIDVNFTLSE